MYDKEYLGAWDLPKGKDTIVTIARVAAKELNNGTKKNRKPVIYFREARSGKGMAVNATNGKTIAAMYGTDTDAWIGKPIALYATTTTFGSEERDCIRVRPRVPRQGGQHRDVSANVAREMLEAFQASQSNAEPAHDPDTGELVDDGAQAAVDEAMSDADRLAAIDRGDA